MNAHKSAALFAALLFFCGLQSASGQFTVKFVEDINKKPLGLESSYLFGWKDKIVFGAWDFDAGIEPRILSDGHVSLIDDIRPSGSSSNPNNFLSLNGDLYFSALDTNCGKKLWRFDGINTERAPNPDPGTCWIDIKQTVIYGGDIYYTGILPGSRFGMLTRYDGKTAELARDGSTGNLIDVETIVGTVDNKLIYVGAGARYEDQKLYSYDGQTVKVVQEQLRGLPDVTGVLLDGYLYFIAWTPESGYELWRTNGLVASMVQDFTVGQNDTSDREHYERRMFAVLGDKVYFMCSNKKDFSQIFGNNDLCVSDGEVVQRLSSIHPGLPFDVVSEIAAVGDRLFIIAGVQDKTLYVYDGKSVTRWSDIDAKGTNLNPSLLLSYDNALYMNSPGDPVAGNQIYKINGNETIQVSHYNGRTANSFPSQFVACNGKLFFVATNHDYEEELYYYDGSSVNKIVFDVGDRGSVADIPYLVRLNETLYVVVRFGRGGYYIYIVDGAVPRIVDVMNYVYDVVVWKNNLILSGTSMDYYSGLFMYDGNNLKMIGSNESNSYEEPQHMAVLEDKLYFVARDDSHGKELWAYDGSKVELVADLSPGLDYTMITKILVNDNRLYLVLDWGHSEVGERDGLYVLDDREIKMILNKKNRFSDNEDEFNASYKGKLYFSAADSQQGVYALYTYDGSEVQPVLFESRNIYQPRYFTTSKDRLYFSSWGVFMTDGNTVYNATSSYNDILKEIGATVEYEGELYFAASDRNYGNELWKLSMTGTSADDEQQVADGTTLSQPYPNPVSGMTSIEYTVSGTSDVEITLYDLLGRRIREIHKASQESGRQTVRFDTSDLPSGMYLYRLVAGETVLTRKLVVVH